jgi:peptidoglycan/xylan/chitin deacetylase (PgdA/CDA1 family)
LATRIKEIILNFHGIGDPPSGTERGELSYWWDRQHFLQAIDKIAQEAKDCSSAVHLTFDDGNASDFEIALPALLERKMTATFFVCAGRVGTRGYLDASRLRYLLNAGMRVGSHGMHHVDWRKLGDAELRTEISDARDKLQDICGSRIDQVSIPFGSYDRRVLTKLKSEPFRHVYTSGRGLALSEAWLKPRNTLDRSWQGKDILKQLAARESHIGHLRRALAGMYRALR